MAMATTSTARRAADHVEDGATRSRLTVVTARKLALRARRRRSRLLYAAAGAILAGALLLVVAGQALVASQQVRLDNLQSELSSAVQSNANLQLDRAELAAPTRILAIAEHTLKMVSPARVTYLTPVDPGPSLEQLSAVHG
jgi:cell division protein FtsL